MLTTYLGFGIVIGCLYIYFYIKKGLEAIEKSMNEKSKEEE